MVYGRMPMIVWKGEFVTQDLVSNTQDDIHSKPFVEGKDLNRWRPERVRYLEWGTSRAPRKFARPTFPQLYPVPEKLIALVVATSGPPVIYDDRGLITTHTSCVFVPWHHLRGVRNRSIKKTASYIDEAFRRTSTQGFGSREEREATSEKFDLKYVLAIMNSEYSAAWLHDQRRSKNHVYPDDWKNLPIPEVQVGRQIEIAKVVDEVFAVLDSAPLEDRFRDHIRRLESQINAAVERLY